MGPWWKDNSRTVEFAQNLRALGFVFGFR